MSITQRETSEYVSKYLLDRYNKSITPTELLDTKPWHHLVWYSFMAHAFYKKEGYYASWNDIPTPYVEGMEVNIVTVNLMERFQFLRGRWYDLGSCNADCWKE